MRARTQSELGASNDLVNKNKLKITLLQLNYPYLSFMILSHQRDYLNFILRYCFS